MMPPDDTQIILEKLDSDSDEVVLSALEDALLFVPDDMDLFWAICDMSELHPSYEVRRTASEIVESTYFYVEELEEE